MKLLYNKEKLLKDNLYRWQQDKVPNERTGKLKTTSGDPDLFKFFTERVYQFLSSRGGGAGLLIPDAFYSSEGSKGLRRLILEHSRIEHFYSYENSWRLFPIDTREKFVAIVFRKLAASEDAEFPAAFMLHDPSWLDAPPDQQATRIVPLSPQFIRRLSPGHLAFVEFSSRIEKALIDRIYDDFPPFVKKSSKNWNVSLGRDLHMGDDSWLFRDRERLREFGATQHIGEHWVLPAKEWFEDRIDKFAWVQRTEAQIKGKESRSAKESGEEVVFRGYVLATERDLPTPAIMTPNDRYVPLYEGRLVHQFDHASKSYVRGSGPKQVWKPNSVQDRQVRPHFFVGEMQAREYLDKSVGNRLCWCDVSNARNERSLMSCLLPSRIRAGNKIPIIYADSKAQPIIAGMLNSLVADWEIRHRYDSTVSYFVLGQSPIPRLTITSDAGTRLSRVVRPLFDPALLAWEKPPDLDMPSRASLRAMIDAIAAQAYGLAIEEFGFVVTSFPLLDRDQPWLPGDGFIAYDKKGRPKFKARSFVTRDKVLLEYCRLLGETPPDDIVAFFAEAGVDIDGGKVLGGEPPADPFNPPIYATGPIRNLEERVRLAEEQLGAIAYVPTVRQKPTEEAMKRITALEARLREQHPVSCEGGVHVEAS